jgi:hypothetical protein
MPREMRSDTKFLPAFQLVVQRIVIFVGRVNGIENARKFFFLKRDHRFISLDAAWLAKLI